MKSPLITNEKSLVSAKSRFGHPIPTYDDGFGPIFIHRDSMGISGIVRAQSWEDAYSICEDEFFPAADEDAGEEMARINAMDEGSEKDLALACWDESYGFRNNSRGDSSIYAKELNGDSLETLTPALLAALEITLEIESPPTEDPGEAEPRWFCWHESRKVNQNGRSVFSMQGRYRMYAGISPNRVQRLKTCLANSHYAPAAGNFCVKWAE